jgi:hypothetical protein
MKYGTILSWAFRYPEKWGTNLIPTTSIKYIGYDKKKKIYLYKSGPGVSFGGVNGYNKSPSEMVKDYGYKVLPSNTW